MVGELNGDPTIGGTLFSNNPSPFGVTNNGAVSSFTMSFCLNSWYAGIMNGTTPVASFNAHHVNADLIIRLIDTYRVNRIVGVAYRFNFRQSGLGSGSDILVGIAMNPGYPIYNGHTWVDYRAIDQYPFVKEGIIPASPQGVALGHTIEGAIDLQRLAIGPDIEYLTDLAYHSQHSWSAAGVFSSTYPTKYLFLTPFFIPRQSGYDGLVHCDYEMTYVMHCDDLLNRAFVSDGWDVYT